MSPLRASRLDQSEYDEAIADGLGRVFRDTKPEPVQLTQLKAVVISDHHRGARDAADDFQRAEPAYSAALGSYLERKYELWLLGDVEELWENDIDEVRREYVDLLKLEREFARGPGAPGLRRFWGNHDLDWKDAGKVTRELGEFLEGVPVREGLRLEVLDGDEFLGTLFLAHGHQGTDFSERFQVFSRFFVRIWRHIQNTQGWLSTTPAHDYDLRAKHDRAMFHWARNMAHAGREREQPLLIAGHTHHPVFPGKPHNPPETADVDKLAAKLEKARANGAGEQQLAEMCSELEGVKAVLRRKGYPAPETDEPPCYFNGGCCCYPDGDVTCLELDGAADAIRLMRWPRDKPTPQDPPPAEQSLRLLFKQVAAAAR